MIQWLFLNASRLSSRVRRRELQWLVRQNNHLSQSQTSQWWWWIVELPNLNLNGWWEGEYDFNSRVHENLLGSEQNRRSGDIDLPISICERTTLRSTWRKIREQAKYLSHLGCKPWHVWTLSTRQRQRTTSPILHWIYKWAHWFILIANRNHGLDNVW